MQFYRLQIWITNGCGPQIALIPLGIYRVISSDRTPKDTAHKQITDQYISILNVVKILKEGNSP